jgi:hypothetical protein
MFSDHLQKIDRSSGRTLFFVAGALVMVCQLVALGMVADGQVKKAQLRDSQLSSQRTAIAQCFENTFDPARSHCVRDVYNSNGSALAAATLSDDRLMDYRSGSTRSPVQAVMAMSFASN